MNQTPKKVSVIIVGEGRQVGKTVLARRIQAALTDLGVRVTYRPRSSLLSLTPGDMARLYPLAEVKKVFDPSRYSEVEIMDVF